MRKEIQASREARMLYRLRSRSAATGEALDLPFAVSDASNVMGRLMKSGLVMREDWEMAARADLRPESLSGPDGKALRSHLRQVLERRVAGMQENWAVVNLSLVRGMMDDVINVILEFAAYSQAYEVMIHAVVDFQRRASRMKFDQDDARTMGVLNGSYKTRPPAEVLAEALGTIEEEKAKVRWAKAKIQREKKVAPGSRSPKAVARDRRLSPAEVASLFHTKAIYKRLRRSLPGPDTRELDLEEPPAVDVS